MPAAKEAGAAAKEAGTAKMQVRTAEKMAEIRPYGDTPNDGRVQLSFTLPLAAGAAAAEAARLLARKMGLQEPQVAFMQDLYAGAGSRAAASGAAIGFSFLILYGRCVHTIDPAAIEVPPAADVHEMDFYEINDFIARRIGRRVVVVGACTGSDAHTLGLDAIMNMKGYTGRPGLERYPWFEAINLGSQVPNETLVAKAIDAGADAILVSQVVTQKDVHVPNLTQLVDLLEAEGIRDDVILICGGPRVSHELAVELGYDAGFGPGTLPPTVAAYIAQEMVRRGLAAQCQPKQGIAGRAEN